MSDNDVFELEPSNGQVQIPVPKRTPPRRHGARVPSAPATTEQGKAARFLGWLAAPRWFYGATLAVTAVVIYALHNPDWGVASRSWPHEALGVGGTFAWNLATARLLALVALAVALLVALCLRSSARRGRIVALFAVLVLATFRTDASPLMLGGLALTGGALLVPRGVHRGALLAIGLGLLGAHLLLPWSAERFTRGIDLAPTWQTNAFDTVDALAAPKPGVVEAKGWPGLVLDRLEDIVALLLAGVGVFALVGAGGRWTRWAAALLLLLLFWGTLGRLYQVGAVEGADACRDGAVHIGRAWFGLAAAYVLGLAAAVADMAAGAPARGG